MSDDPSTWTEEIDDLLEMIPATGGETTDWVRAGALLASAGAKAVAVPVYSWAARRLALAGKLPQAASLVKGLQELAPRHRETAEAVARLYAHRERVTRGEAVRDHLSSALPELDPAEAPPPFAPLLERLTAAARAEADAIAASAPPTGTLPTVPFFSRLSANELRDLVDRSRCQRFAAGEDVVREGEIGASFFVVTAGQARVHRAGPEGRRLELGRLDEGEVFGELGFFSGAARTATVSATVPLEVLEIGRDVLNGLLALHPHVREALEAHGRERLVGTIVESSPLFASVPPSERPSLLEDFRTVAAAAGETLIEAGQPGTGFHVVLAGEIVVSGPDGEEMARLGPGEFFGEIGAMTGVDATATCVASRPSQLFHLPRARFTALVAAYPPVLAVLTEAARSRIASSRERGLEVGSEALARAGLL